MTPAAPARPVSGDNCLTSATARLQHPERVEFRRSTAPTISAAGLTTTSLPVLSTLLAKLCRHPWVGYRQNPVDLGEPTPSSSHFPRYCPRFPTLLLVRLARVTAGQSPRMGFSAPTRDREGQRDAPTLSDACRRQSTSRFRMTVGTHRPTKLLRFLQPHSATRPPERSDRRHP